MIYVVSASRINTSSEVPYKSKEVLKAFSTKEKAEEYISKLPYRDGVSAHIDFTIEQEQLDTSITDTFITAFFYEFLTRNIYVADVREVLFGVIKDSVSNTVDWIRLKAIIMTAVDAFASPFMQEVLEKLGIAPYIIEEALLA